MTHRIGTLVNLESIPATFNYSRGIHIPQTQYFANQPPFIDPVHSYNPNSMSSLSGFLPTDSQYKIPTQVYHHKDRIEPEKFDDSNGTLRTI